MKLEQAITESRTLGKRFTRPDWNGEYITGHDIDLGYELRTSDILADDYMLETDEVTLTEADFAEAWNSARDGFPSIKAAGTSDFYKALVAELFSR